MLCVCDLHDSFSVHQNQNCMRNLIRLLCVPIGPVPVDHQGAKTFASVWEKMKQWACKCQEKWAVVIKIYSSHQLSFAVMLQAISSSIKVNNVDGNHFASCPTYFLMLSQVTRIFKLQIKEHRQIENFSMKLCDLARLQIFFWWWLLNFFTIMWWAKVIFTVIIQSLCWVPSQLCRGFCQVSWNQLNVAHNGRPRWWRPRSMVCYCD